MLFATSCSEEAADACLVNDDGADDEACDDSCDERPECGPGEFTPCRAMLRLALRCSLGVTAAYSLSMSAGARRADNHLTIVATGGTFDKDYPRSTRGYAFEIDEPAAGRVLDGMPFLGLSYDVVSVCRKDSTEIDDSDRAAIAGAVASAAGRLVVVTHGTDTLIESARHVARSGSAAGKSVVFCGAMKPERFKDSDAAFNLAAPSRRRGGRPAASPFRRPRLRLRRRVAQHGTGLCGPADGGRT